MKAAEKCGLDDLMDIKVRYKLSDKFNATAWFMMTKYNVLVRQYLLNIPCMWLFGTTISRSYGNC